MGIKVVKYKGEGCISCGICFYIADEHGVQISLSFY
jgi:hypothetical protein